MSEGKRVKETPRDGAGKRKKKRMSRIGLIFLALVVFLIVSATGAIIYMITHAPEPVQPGSTGGGIKWTTEPGTTTGGTDPGTTTGGTGSSGSGTGTTDPGTVTVDPPKPKVLKENFYTFLIVGTNDDYNADTIMLGAIDTSTLECNIINIPRDSMIDTTAKIKRINGAYGRAGIDGLCSAVQEVTGVYPQYYCVLNMKSFIKVVDVIGGVEYNVPMRMYHPDAQSEFTIDLYPGWQTLDGDHALQMVRFRGTAASDFGRIELQRKFLVATLKQVREKFTLTKATSIIETIAKSIKTNMSAKDMVWFYTNVVTKLDFDRNVKFHTLPYTTTGYYAGQAYVFLDRAKIVELVNKTVNPFTTDFEESELKVPNENGFVNY